jgi:dTDP-6-deoxy-L-talose 4-dehydrogenase (NAD+)
LQNQINGIVNCCSGNPITIKDLVNNFILQKNKKIKLNFGYYPYPDYEPMHFWGDNTKINLIIGNK